MYSVPHLHYFKELLFIFGFSSLVKIYIDVVYFVFILLGFGGFSELLIAINYITKNIG